MTTIFEWDEDKSRLNVGKHGSSFEEGKTVFNDPFAITIGDPDHSDDEARYIDIGLSSMGSLTGVAVLQTCLFPSFPSEIFQPA